MRAYVDCIARRTESHIGAMMKAISDEQNAKQTFSEARCQPRPVAVTLLLLRAATPARRPPRSHGSHCAPPAAGRSAPVCCSQPPVAGPCTPPAAVARLSLCAAGRGSPHSFPRRATLALPRSSRDGVTGDRTPGVGLATAPPIAHWDSHSVHRPPTARARARARSSLSRRPPRGAAQLDVRRRRRGHVARAAHRGRRRGGGLSCPWRGSDDDGLPPATVAAVRCSLLVVRSSKRRRQSSERSI